MENKELDDWYNACQEGYNNLVDKVNYLAKK